MYSRIIKTIQHILNSLKGKDYNKVYSTYFQKRGHTGLTTTQDNGVLVKMTSLVDCFTALSARGQSETADFGRNPVWEADYFI